MVSDTNVPLYLKLSAVKIALSPGWSTVAEY